MSHIKLLLSLGVTLFLSVPTQATVFLLHGSFASDSKWHQPGGHFHENLSNTASEHNHSVISHVWSGSVGKRGIVKAARSFAERLIDHVGEEIILIGHSNGGNVISFTTHLLNGARSIAWHPDTALTIAERLCDTLNAQEEEPTKQASITTAEMSALLHDISERYKKKQAITRSPEHQFLITASYFLGTPINTRRYPVSMDIVQHVYNLYSSADGIQPLVGAQTIPEHERCINLHVQIEQDGSVMTPSHSDMRHSLIGKWILKIPTVIHEDKLDKKDTRLIDGHIIFDEHEAPRYVPES